MTDHQVARPIKDHNKLTPSKWSAGRWGQHLLQIKRQLPLLTALCPRATLAATSPPWLLHEANVRLSDQPKRERKTCSSGPYGRRDQSLYIPSSPISCSVYQSEKGPRSRLWTILPNRPIKAGHGWGQHHTQGANLGSNGILKVPVQESHDGCHQPTLDPLLSNQYMPGQHILTCRVLTN